MRRILLLAIALVVSVSLFSSDKKESKTRYYRHEISASIGYTRVRSCWSDSYERNVMDGVGLIVGKAGSDGIIEQGMNGPNLHCTSPWPPDISYLYHMNRSFAVGGLFCGYRVSDWMGYPRVNRMDEEQRTGYTYVKGFSLFLLPTVKWSWMNCHWCSLYTKGAVGFHFQSLHLNSESLPPEQTEKFRRKHLGVAYFIFPVGWEVGRRKVRWFIEGGYGSNTFFQTGLMFRFKRY